jgi:excisionase family DNA binding protein
MAILTDKELQAVLKVSRQTLWRLRKASALPYFKVGGQYRYRSEEIDRWLAETGHRDRQYPPQRSAPGAGEGRRSGEDRKGEAPS